MYIVHVITRTVAEENELFKQGYLIALSSCVLYIYCYT